MKKIIVNYSGVMTFLTLCLSIEVIVGGGGRIFEFSNFTLRMFLFFFIVSLSLLSFLLLNQRSNKKILVIFIVTVIYLLMGTSIGLSNNSIDSVLLDLKPQLYLCLIICAPLLLKVDKIFISVTQVASVIMALCYLLVWFLMNFEYIPFTVVYLLNDTGEFFFRGEEGFVYKGFMFVLIGSIFYVADENRSLAAKLIALSILLTSMYLTYSRGFLITFLLCFVLVVFLGKNLFYRFIGLSVLFFSIIAVPYILNTFEGRAASDASRLSDLKYLYDHFSSTENFFIGSGFGAMINGRNLIEYSLIDVTYKVGLMGLLYWLLLYLLVLNGFLKKKDMTSKFMFLAVTAIYIQSFFNPYMNNPIGIYVIVVALVTLYGKKRENYD